MDEQTLKRLLDEALEPITGRLDDPKTGLKRTNEKIDVLWDQVEKITFGMEDIKETLDSYTTQLKSIETKTEKISDDTGKLDKRLLEVEDNVGIVPRPELTLVR